MPEGSSDDDSDQDGGLPDEQDDDCCATPQDIWKSKSEDLGDTHER